MCIKSRRPRVPHSKLRVDSATIDVRYYVDTVYHTL